MAMRLERLALLHDNMLTQGMTKTKFDFRFRNLLFAVIYIAERFPHELLFGCRASNLFFVVSVETDFVISTYLGDTYSELIKALGLRADPANRFRPGLLFEEFGLAIPIATFFHNVPTITEIALNRRDVEESEKKYFYGWIPHDGVKSSPTGANLAKTKRICGQTAHDICARHHISSRWTDIEALAQHYREPVV